jgi:hypothetical protein
MQGWFGVSRGRQTGVFDSFDVVKAATDRGFARPRWKRFRTKVSRVLEYGCGWRSWERQTVET